MDVRTVGVCTHRRLVWLGVSGLVVFGASCSRGEAPEGRSATAGPVVAKTSARPYSGPPCAGASDAETRAVYHPQVLRGRVVRPDVAAPGKTLEDRPARAVSVSVFRRAAGAGLAVDGAALQTTRTDHKGRWCVRLPDGVSVDGALSLVAQAEVDGVRLRHLIAYRQDARVDLGSEALVRLVDARGGVTPALSAQRYMNLRTISGTALSLWRPEDAAALHEAQREELVRRAVAMLSKDARVQAALGE